MKMSDLKHQPLEELQRRRKTCVGYKARLETKLNAEVQRLHWIDYYIREKETQNAS